MKASHVLLLLLTIVSFRLYSQKDTLSNGYFYGRGSVGLMVGNLSSGSAQISSGYRFKCGLEAGVGLGVESFYERYAPLFGEVRYNVGSGKTQPFVGFMGGFLFQLNGYYANSSVNGTLGAQFGLTHFFNKHIGLSTSVGYRYAALNQGYYYLHTYFAPEQYVISNHRAEIRIGLILK